MIDPVCRPTWKVELDARIKYWDNRAKELTSKINSMVIQNPIEIKRMRSDFLLEMNQDLRVFEEFLHINNPIVYVKINDDTNEIKVQPYM